MSFVALPNGTIEDLDRKLLDDSGRIKLHRASFYADIPHDYLRGWCLLRARYQIPTVELVYFLKGLIGDRKAIEIGSGNGDLYWHLGIPGTDNYSQQLPEAQLFMRVHRQVATNPPADVHRMEAVDAIDHFKPDIAIAAWLTEKWCPISQSGQTYGPEEEDIIRRCTYVHVGNATIHGTKRIMKHPHRVCHLNGMVSRAQYQDANCVYLWQKI